MQSKGFSLLELMIGIAVAGILLMIGVPALSEFTVKMRVDNEIGDIRRVLLAARNSAVNSGVRTTACPLNGGTSCTTQWHKEITVFTDLDGDQIYEPADNEVIVAKKNAASSSDSLTNPKSAITYSPDGTLASVSNSTFIYCPSGFPKAARGIVVSKSGRAKKTIDSNNNGTDNHPVSGELYSYCP